MTGSRLHFESDAKDARHLYHVGTMYLQAAADSIIHAHRPCGWGVAVAIDSRLTNQWQACCLIEAKSKDKRLRLESLNLTWLLRRKRSTV